MGNSSFLLVHLNYHVSNRITIIICLSYKKKCTIWLCLPFFSLAWPKWKHRLLKAQITTCIPHSCWDVLKQNKKSMASWKEFKKVVARKHKCQMPFFLSAEMLMTVKKPMLFLEKLEFWTLSVLQSLKKMRKFGFWNFDALTLNFFLTKWFSKKPLCQRKTKLSFLLVLIHRKKQAWGNFQEEVTEKNSESLSQTCDTFRTNENELFQLFGLLR